MKLYERVLVAVGAGDTGIDLIGYARGLAAILDGALFTFAHVLGWSKEPTRHADALARLQRDVAADFGRDEARCVVVHGVAVDRLLDLADEIRADLVLVGHARENNWRRSLARRLAMQAPCSLWMKPFRASSSFGRVLAAVDYTESSAHALSVAGYVARRAGAAGCRALHAAQAGDAESGRAAFENFAARLDTAGVEIEPVFAEGSGVADAIDEVAASDPVDLVVMGSHDRSRSESTLLGGECEEVLMQSRTPVLVVKGAAERERGRPRALAAGRPSLL